MTKSSKQKSETAAAVRPAGDRYDSGVICEVLTTKTIKVDGAWHSSGCRLAMTEEAAERLIADGSVTVPPGGFVPRPRVAPPVLTQEVTTVRTIKIDGVWHGPGICLVMNQADAEKLTAEGAVLTAGPAAR